MGELTQDIVVVTGATGFLGRRVVMRAVDSGFRVRAVVRPGRNVSDMPWLSDSKVEIIEMDLADESSDFSRMIEGGETSVELARAVIHTAGILVGTREQHERLTVQPTRRLIEAMKATGCSKLVHISSISVYGYASMPDGSQLDELAPTEPDLDDRDDYCIAKYMQEQIILQLAQAGHVEATVLRPGVICGYERYWTSRLGVKKAGVLLQFNRHGKLPVTFVDHCAEAAILAVQREEFQSDVYIKPELAYARCGFEVFNVVGDYQPSQEEYIALLREANLSPFRVRLRVPWLLAKAIINGISLSKVFLPTIYRKIPLLLRSAAFHARMKGLRYCSARLQDRLGWYPQQDTRNCIVDSWKTHGDKLGRFQ